MSIASEITRLQGVKSDILQAISDKGVTVPSGSALDDCPGLIASISGGGGIPNKIHQDFVYKNILGKMYKCVEISDKVFFPVQNLDYIDESITHTDNFSQVSSVPACAYYDYAQTGDNGFFYNNSAISYIDSIKTSQMKNFDQTYFNLLINYLAGLVANWLGTNTHPSNELLTTFAKNIDFDTYEDWLGLIDIGLGTYGSYAGVWTKYPYEYSNPVYCGFASKSYGGLIDVYQGKTLRFHNGDIGNSTCYPMRFFIDEN